MTNYGLADEIRAIGIQITEMRSHREALEMKRAEAAKVAEEAQKIMPEVSVTASQASDISSRMLNQEELLSMTPKDLQKYMTEVQNQYTSWQEGQAREIRKTGRAAAEQTEKFERRHYEAQMRDYNRTMNDRRAIVEKLLLEQKNLP